MDLRFRKPLLYPAELQDQKKIADFGLTIGIKNPKSINLKSATKLSGRQDSNLRPSAPKADALAGLRYAPIYYLSTTQEQYFNLYNCAEREGFEPSVPLSKYGSLANYWFKPLTHLSLYMQRVANLEKKFT